MTIKIFSPSTLVAPEKQCCHKRKPWVVVFFFFVRTRDHTHIDPKNSTSFLLGTSLISETPPNNPRTPFRTPWSYHWLAGNRGKDLIIILFPIPYPGYNSSVHKIVVSIFSSIHRVPAKQREVTPISIHFPCSFPPCSALNPTTPNPKPWVLPPLNNSWKISIIWLYIALNRNPNIDCY